MNKENTQFETLKGFGPKSKIVLNQIGIHTIDQLKSENPYKIYKKLKAQIPGTSLNFLYAIIGAVEDKHWQEIKKTQRTEILLTLEQMGLAPK